LDSRSAALLHALQSVLHEHGFGCVVRHIMHAAQQLTGAEAASLFLIDRRRRRLDMAASTNLPQRLMEQIAFPVGTGVAGWVALTGESVNLEDISRDPRHYAGVGKITGFATRGYLCVPLKAGTQILGTIQVMNHRRGGRFSHADQDLLEAFAVVASLALQKSRLHQAEVKKRRMELELSVAQAFQQKMLPRSFNAPSGLRISASNLPARRMGGDLYDGFAVGNRYYAMVGDVSGKGPGAALWMASLSGLLRYLGEQGGNLLEQTASIDAHLAALMPSGTFITLLITALDGEVLTYMNAGHNPGLLATREGAIHLLAATGLPIGPFPDLPRQVKRARFRTGDRIVLYTDGVVEAGNRRGEMYGMDRLLRFVRRARAQNTDEAVHALVRSVRRFAAGTEQSDDITVMLVDRLGDA